MILICIGSEFLFMFFRRLKSFKIFRDKTLKRAVHVQRSPDRFSKETNVFSVWVLFALPKRHISIIRRLKSFKTSREIKRWKRAIHVQRRSRQISSAVVVHFCEETNVLSVWKLFSPLAIYPSSLARPFYIFYLTQIRFHFCQKTNWILFSLS